MPGLVLVLDDDVLFSARLENSLRFNGYQPYSVAIPQHVGEALNAFPVLALVNIGSPSTRWQELVPLIKTSRAVPSPTVVGFGPHVDLALRQVALDGGCDVVVGRSAVANGLDSLLRRHAWRPEPTICGQSLPSGVVKGIEQFNRRAFFRCHDSIEAVWVEEKSDARFLYQGLLQIGVAFYHARRGNFRGAIKMMARGKGKLLPFHPVCQGIDVEDLLGHVERCESALTESDARWLEDSEWFPKIRFSS